MNGRIMAVDPGEKRLGIALSDPTATLASPLAVVKHVSRMIDAAAIASLAEEHDVVLIVIGQALDDENMPTPQARHAARLVDALRQQTSISVKLWDESDSTQTARGVRVAMGASRRKRSGHLDDLAAAVILQSYLDAHKEDFEHGE